MCYNTDTNEREANTVMDIKIGSQLKDGWGRMWFVIGFENDRYTMKLINYPGSPDTFSKSTVKKNFKLINP